MAVGQNQKLEFKNLRKKFPRFPRFQSFRPGPSLLIDVIFRSLKFFQMLFGPDNLWESNEDIIKDISSLSVGVKKNLFVFVLHRYSV